MRPAGGHLATQLGQQSVPAAQERTEDVVGADDQLLLTGIPVSEQLVMEPIGSSPCVCPRRRSTAQVSIAPFNDWFKKRAGDPKRLFASGFANLSRHGFEFTSVARDAHGVNSATIVRYLAEFHSAKAAIAGREVRASTAKRKRSRSP